MKAIKKFRGPYACFSNFFWSLLIYEGKEYPTSEHAFQAMKTLDPEARRRIRLAGSPRDAKRLGRAAELREDWDEVKVQIMHEICLDKFRQNPRIRHVLLSTGDALLVEGNYWHDTFWGVCSCPECPEGSNELGNVLMKVREELREEMRDERRVVEF